MATRDADVIQIIEADAELRTDQGVCWWIELARHAVWLETVDTGSHEVDVVTPSGDDWVPIDGRARDPCGREALLIALPRIGIGHGLARLRKAISNEGIHAIAVGVAASGTRRISSPEVVLANSALAPLEAKLRKRLGRVELLRVRGELWLSQSLNLLCRQTGDFLVGHIGLFFILRC